MPDDPYIPEHPYIHIYDIDAIANRLEEILRSPSPCSLKIEELKEYAPVLLEDVHRYGNLRYAEGVEDAKALASERERSAKLVAWVERLTLEPSADDTDAD